LESLFYWYHDVSEPYATSVTRLLLVLLLALWVDADSKDYPQIKRPFDYGFLVLMFWLPYLPYYLWRTRGGVGLLMFGGFMSLLIMGNLSKSLIYYLMFQ
jgi:hypothetical protein